jgi:hypothetical protein
MDRSNIRPWVQTEDRSFNCEERELCSFLSLRDPAALPGRPGHPTSFLLARWD